MKREYFQSKNKHIVKQFTGLKFYMCSYLHKPYIMFTLVLSKPIQSKSDFSWEFIKRSFNLKSKRDKAQGRI